MNKQEIEKAIEIIANDKKAFESVNHGGFTNKIKAFELAISALEQQLTNGWIPCIERLPDKTDEYLCTVEWYGTSSEELLINNGYEIERRIKIVHYLDSTKSFKECDGFSAYKVIAWKLSEPWKGDIQ